MWNYVFEKFFRALDMKFLKYIVHVIIYKWIKEILRVCSSFEKSKNKYDYTLFDRNIFDLTSISLSF